MLGTYRNVGPCVETSRGVILIFQTPHMGGSLSQEAKEDLWIVGLLQLWQITWRRWNKLGLNCHYDSNFCMIEMKEKIRVGEQSCRCIIGGTRFTKSDPCH